MRWFRPIYGVVAVVAFGALMIAGDYALKGAGRGDYQRVAPGPDGTVRIELAGFEDGKVRFYRFLNAANQEVKFFAGRDAGGRLQVAFDANELCYKLKRGYRHQEEWVVCNKCDKAFLLEEVNAGGGGCKPVPLPHRVEGDELVVAEIDVLKGWRLFR